MPSSCSSKTDFICIFSCVFRSNLCINFIGSCLLFLFLSFGAFGLLHAKLLFIKNGFHMHLLLCFSLKPLHQLYWFLFAFSLSEFWSFWSSSCQALVHQKRISYASSLVFFAQTFASTLLVLVCFFSF